MRKVGVSPAHYHTSVRVKESVKSQGLGSSVCGRTAAVTERPLGAASGTACRGADGQVRHLHSPHIPVEPRLQPRVQCDTAKNVAQHRTTDLLKTL